MTVLPFDGQETSLQVGRVPVASGRGTDGKTVRVAGAAFAGPRPELAGAEPVKWRTLEDIDDAPPGELLLGMIEDGPNLWYAAGGTGKGTTGAYLIRELLAIGRKPMIYDAENRPREWSRRTSGLGVHRSEVVYLQPADLPARLMGQPAWDITPHLGRVARAAGADLLFVDSILPAVGFGEERLKSDAQAPYLYVAALDDLGIPSVSFGHPPRATPDGDPYGSVSWVNAMRLTWLGSPGEGDGHRVRWRPRKRNERGHIPGVLLTFKYGEDRRLCDVTREDDDETTREWLMVALRREPRTVEGLAEGLAEQSPRETDRIDLERIKGRLRQALGRMKHDGIANRQSRKRGAPWVLTA